MKRRVARILAAGALFAAGLIVGEGSGAGLTLLGAAYLLSGWDVLWYAVRNLLSGQVFGENLLMGIATLGALAIGQYGEAVAVMVFYQVGEAFQDHAVNRSRQSISRLMDLRPDHANLLTGEESRRVPPEEVAVGQLILVRPGERVPLDGQVVAGSSALDTAMLTGEALPREALPGDQVLSGTVNLSSPLTIRVSHAYGEGTVSRILELVENASEKKSRSEGFITRFSQAYTPAVVALALGLAVLPPLATGQAFGGWVYRALSFLVVSCPCALVISIPLSFFGGIGGASRQGILVKGGNYLEALAQVRTVVFDKTGTLTRGRLTVSRVAAEGVSEEGLLLAAARLEAHSSHPIAQSLREAVPEAAAQGLCQVEELGGRGIRAQLDGLPALAGTARWLEEEGIRTRPQAAAGTAVHVALGGRYMGHIVFADQLKPGAAEAVRQLRTLGIRELALVSGDGEWPAREAAGALGIERVHAGLLPQDKVRVVEGLLAAQRAGERLAFVGDGVNDAPVLARSDVGVAMGGLGSDAAIEAADLVLMTDEPAKLAQAVRIARRTVGIARQNAVLAIGVKAAVLALSAAGAASLWAAVFADVGVAVLAVINAMRTLRYKGLK